MVTDPLLYNKFIGEGFDDTRDLVRHADQRTNDWKTFYGVATVAEAYLRGDSGLHLHVVFHPGSQPPVNNRVKHCNTTGRQGRNFSDLGIQFQRHPWLNAAATSPDSTHLVTSDGSRDDGEQAVFVGIVQLRKKKKGVTPTPVPSLVWLKRLDACPERLFDTFEGVQPVLATRPPETRDEVSTRPPSFGVSNKIDGESGSVIGWGEFQNSKLPGQSVEGRPEIVDNLADKNTPPIRETFRGTSDAQASVPCLTVALG